VLAHWISSLRRLAGRSWSDQRYVTPLYGGWVFAAPESDGSSPLRCSARGCRARATVDLGWRNPNLHAAGRVKHWLACDQHADHLADFLGRRGFLLAREPIGS
jgi:hypothetical protein